MMIHARSRRMREISDGFAAVSAGLAPVVVGCALTSTSCHGHPERQSVGVAPNWCQQAACPPDRGNAARYRPTWAAATRRGGGCSRAAALDPPPPGTRTIAVMPNSWSAQPKLCSEEATVLTCTDCQNQGIPAIRDNPDKETL